MDNRLVELNTVDDLDRLLASNPGRPVVLYKHSLTCGTSGMALEEIQGLLEGPDVGAPVGLVLIQPARAVSTAIAERFGLRHESPQVLIVRDGQVVWHGSHFRVTAEAITSAQSDAEPPATSRVESQR